MDSVQRATILLRTFPGLSLPSTVTFTVPSTATASDLLSQINNILPPALSGHLTLTTTSNRLILPSSEPISIFGPSTALKHDFAHHAPHILPLNLNAPLPGGKGGFGSQLRAAGGRMSSRRRKNALASDPNAGVGSNRNLDGRRLRTITEAKNLAEYLATRPEMERREKEERRKRWEGIIEGAERREEELKKGGAGGGRGKGLSEEWLDEKEDAGERTREAVRKAMAGGQWKDSVAGRQGNGEASASASGSGASRATSEEDSQEEDGMDLDDDEIQTLEKEAAQGDTDAIWVLKNQTKKLPAREKEQERRFVGFDEDDEFMSTSGDEQVAPSTAKGKGKVKKAPAE